MPTFDARLRISGRSRLPMAVVIDLTGDRMAITADTGPVANWRLETLEIVSHTDGFHVRVDDEDIILSVNDARRFASELMRQVR